MQEVVILSDNITPRLQYTAELIFKTILGCNYSIISLQKYTPENNKITINYSSSTLNECLNIPVTGLIHEQGIRQLTPDIDKTNDIPIIFTVKNTQEPDIEFDIFSAVFYFASRYEEYSIVKKDKHDRINSSELFAVKNGFHRLPIVHLWCNLLSEHLKQKFPEFSCTKPVFNYVSTIDVDNAYAFKGKSIWRQLTGISNSLLRLHFYNVYARFKVLLGKQKDPYDTYEFIKTIKEQYKLTQKFFFLVGKPGKYDRNLNPDKKPLHEVIQHVREFAEIGLHPSYASYLKPDVILFEKERLEAITKKTSISRQHFLRLRLPETYQILEKLNITEDYTMGFADNIGFRAGICIPYKLYDLKNECVINVTAYPFQAMDVSLRQYLKLTPQQAIKEIKNIIDQIYTVGGTFISLWHNESLSEWREWKEWQTVYTQMLEYINDRISAT